VFCLDKAYDAAEAGEIDYLIVTAVNLCPGADANQVMVSVVSDYQIVLVYRVDQQLRLKFEKISMINQPSG
jgi:hypothetical protein